MELHSINSKTSFRLQQATIEKNTIPDTAVKLIKVDGNIMPEDNEGNPSNYYKTTIDAGNTGALLTASGTADCPLGHGGGLSSFSNDTISTISSEITTSHGFTSSYSCMIGGGIFGNEVTVGYYVDLDYSHSVGHSKSTSVGNSLSATITNISSGMNGIDDSILSRYNFNWNFGRWMRSLSTDGTTVPVIGYFVNNVSFPGNSVRNLTALLDSTDLNKVNLTWTVPDTTGITDTVLGYNLYRSNDFSPTEKLNTELITTLSATDEGLTPGKLYTYYITTLYQTSDKSSVYESIASDSSSVICGTTGNPGTDGLNGETPYIGENGNWFVGSSDTGVKATGENGNTPQIGANGNWFVGSSDTGVKAVGENGNTPQIGANGNWWIGSTDTGVKAAGTNGTDGKDGETAYEAAVANGYTGTYDEWLKVTGVTCAVKGHTYKEYSVPASCEANGLIIKVCTVCGATEIEETPATAHVPGEWICEDPATGKYVRRCEECYTILDTKTVAIEIGNGSLDSDSPALDENGVLNLSYKQSEQLKLSSSGAEAEKVIYTSSNPKVAEVDAEGNVTAVVHGDAVITATVPGTAIELQVPVKVELTWWQRVHYVLNSIAVFRLLFMLFGVDVSN